MSKCLSVVVYRADLQYIHSVLMLSSFQEADMTKAVLGTSLQCASNGSVRSTPQSTAMPAYNSVSLMSGYVVGQPTAASSVTPLQTGRAGLDWGQYYYVSIL